ncbi:MAG: hypothetical protein OXM61_07235 [Candidatus Poribacteria bacterium]|nr:hypothetical protein [Candidatus Poribacteria bacterium]
MLHLRGDARTSGERRRAEAGNVFGGGSRTPVAVTIFVKNPNATHEDCKIQYRDIGDYFSREEKLNQLHEAESISGFGDWEPIIPDQHHDWIEQRSDAFAKFIPLGTKEAKAGRADNTIHQLFSNHDACAENAELMTKDYLDAISELEENPELTVDEVARRHSTNIKWDRELKNNLKRKKKTKSDDNYIRKVVYRPFIPTNCYADFTFAQMKYQMDRIFPDSTSENIVICVPGIGSKKPFSALMTDIMPDLGFNEACQCFPRWKYPKTSEEPDASETLLDVDEPPERIDNISDTALKAFQKHYKTDKITKDEIFYYVYGILHAPSYREQFENDLSKMIPRIPYAPDFSTFADAGYKLAELHLNYETCEQYPLRVEFPNISSPPASLEDADSDLFRLTDKAMRYGPDMQRQLDINTHVRLSGIPEDAYRYVVNGRSPIEWFIDRYYIKTDKDSGIVNDPNGWFADPRDLVAAIKRIVYVSVESARIVDNLPAEITAG